MGSVNKKVIAKKAKAKNLSSKKTLNLKKRIKEIQVNILLVEDSKIDAYMTKVAVEKHVSGLYNVVHVDSLAKAEKALGQDCNIDIVLLDLGLPDTRDSDDTFDRIKKVEIIKEKIPVVILTSEEDHDRAVKYVGKGAADYIKKSIIRENPELLCDTVEFALTRHKHITKLKQETDAKLKEQGMVLGWFSGDYSVTC